jgi:hypothetical protein
MMSRVVLHSQVSNLGFQPQSHSFYSLQQLFYVHFASQLYELVPLFTKTTWLHIHIVNI